MTTFPKKPNRVHGDAYIGNQQYRGTNAANFKFCFGCDAHRASGGGKLLGGLKLYHCAECVARRATMKEQAK